MITYAIPNSQENLLQKKDLKIDVAGCARQHIISLWNTACEPDGENESLQLKLANRWTLVAFWMWCRDHVLSPDGDRAREFLYCSRTRKRGKKCKPRVQWRFILESKPFNLEECILIEVCYVAWFAAGKRKEARLKLRKSKSRVREPSGSERSAPRPRLRLLLARQVAAILSFDIAVAD